jgi:hypothetical protein
VVSALAQTVGLLGSLPFPVARAQIEGKRVEPGYDAADGYVEAHGVRGMNLWAMIGLVEVGWSGSFQVTLYASGWRGDLGLA